MYSPQIPLNQYGLGPTARELMAQSQEFGSTPFLDGYGRVVDQPAADQGVLETDPTPIRPSPDRDMQQDKIDALANGAVATQQPVSRRPASQFELTGGQYGYEGANWGNPTALGAFGYQQGDTFDTAGSNVQNLGGGFYYDAYDEQLYAPEGTTRGQIPLYVKNYLGNGSNLIYYNPETAPVDDGGGGGGGAGGGGAGGGDTGQTGFDWRTSPSYQFRLNQGLQSLDRGYGGLGQRLSGNRLLGLQEFAQNTASQEYQNVFNNIGTLAGLGANATSISAGSGNTAASNVGNLSGQIGAAQGQGAANAANIGLASGINTGNTIGNAVGGFINNGGFGGGINTGSAPNTDINSLGSAATFFG